MRIPLNLRKPNKLWMDTNRKPTIRDAQDKATFSRLHAIPFLVRIPPEEIDRDLPGKLVWRQLYFPFNVNYISLSTTTIFPFQRQLYFLTDDN